MDASIHSCLAGVQATRRLPLPHPSAAALHHHHQLQLAAAQPNSDEFSMHQIFVPPFFSIICYSRGLLLLYYDSHNKKKSIRKAERGCGVGASTKQEERRSCSGGRRRRATNSSSLIASNPTQGQGVVVEDWWCRSHPARRWTVVVQGNATATATGGARGRSRWRRDQELRGVPHLSPWS